ncbi:MAG: hypothetical protein K5770_03135 [Lachnospiraceae bacterium]|nr:hypothetical protein [Lachnospiraceae bacterium]
MESVKEQKCPDCGAAMRFDPLSDKLVCDYCGKVMEIKASKKEPPDKGSISGKADATAKKEKQNKTEKEKTSGDTDSIVNGFDFDSLNEMASRPDAQSLPIYNCVSCGAEVIASPEQVATSCPYCGNNIVLTQKVSGQLRPDGLIPFKIDSKAMPAAVRNYYKGKKLLPRRFFADSVLGNVTGVYVPFWVFSGKLSGRLTYSAEQHSSFREGDYRVTQTDHYQLTRDVEASFENVPVDAGEKISDALMDSLEPFNMKDVKPFDMRYLAGFTADRFDVAKDETAKHAQKRMHSTTAQSANSHAGAGYTNVSASGGRLSASLSAKYLLFPVYMFDVVFNGKKYPFAVNGQTGKVSGELPIDEGVSRAYYWLRVGILGGGLMLFSFIKYMLGY